MIDEVRVLRLLRSVTDDLAVLKVEARAEADRRADPIWLRGVKYTFVTAIEACIDVAQHLCSAQGWGPPKDNGDAMAILGGRGVLDAPLSEQMRRAVGFRNVLVHEYVEVDDSVVVAQLSDTSDLADFVAALAHFVETRTEPDDQSR
jgi:uncharacterized protein YutE (UPF0331/DUF86 family)